MKSQTEEVADILWMTPEEIFDAFKNDYGKFSKFLSVEQFNQMLTSLDEKVIDNEILNYDIQKIKVITYLSKDYPQDFLNFKNINKNLKINFWI